MSDRQYTPDTGIAALLRQRLVSHARMSPTDAAITADLATHAAQTAVDKFNHTLKHLEGKVWINATAIGLQLLAAKVEDVQRILKEDPRAVTIVTFKIDVARPQ